MRSAIAVPGGPASARWRGTTGCARSTESGCSSRRPTSCRPARASPTRRPRRCAATSSWPLRRDWTPCAYRPTSPIPSCTTPPTSSACWCCRTFPLQWGYAHQIRREAVRQVREAVNTLGHHPSIVQWCAHDEPVADAPQMEHESTGRWLRRLVSKQLPTWNKSVLDRWLKRAFEQADPTRPAVAHSGVTPYLPRLDGTDTHLWLGWHRGDLEDLGERARLMPRRGALRQRVRRPVGPRLSRRVHRPLTMAGARLGVACASTMASRSR